MIALYPGLDAAACDQAFCCERFARASAGRTRPAKSGVLPHCDRTFRAVLSPNRSRACIPGLMAGPSSKADGLAEEGRGRQLCSFALSQGSIGRVDNARPVFCGAAAQPVACRAGFGPRVRGDREKGGSHSDAEELFRAGWASLHGSFPLPLSQGSTGSEMRVRAQRNFKLSRYSWGSACSAVCLPRLLES